MNWRRGLTRAWMICSGIFFVVVIALGYPSISAEFAKAHSADADYYDMVSTILVPVPCEKARGKKDQDYHTESVGPGCWYEMPKFRALYPEYKDMSNKDLSDRMYDAVPGSRGDYVPPKPWTWLFEYLAVALGIPVLVYLLGKSAFWVAAGFKHIDAGSA